MLDLLIFPLCLLRLISLSNVKPLPTCGLSETQIRKKSEIAFQRNHVRVCLKRKSGIFANCVSDKPHVGKGLILLWLISWRRHREIFSMVCLKRNLRILPKSRFRQTTQSSQYWLKKFPTCFHHALPGWLHCLAGWSARPLDEQCSEVVGDP
jgi:hypothetical protein